MSYKEYGRKVVRKTRKKTATKLYNGKSHRKWSPLSAYN